MGDVYSRVSEHCAGQAEHIRTLWGKDVNNNSPILDPKSCRPSVSDPLQIYMAECSSKSDEYGRDDGGNTYPSLHAMLVGHLPELNPDRGREASTV